MNEITTENAIIESARIGLDRGFILSAWVYVKFKGGGGGFGGYCLGALGDAKCGQHDKAPNLAAEFIVSVLNAVGVEQWHDLPGKTIRIRHEGWGGSIREIGHIVDDDKWFNPKERFAAMVRDIPSPAVASSDATGGEPNQQKPGRTLYACQKCGEEFGEGEQDRGRSPCCHAQGDPIGECEDDTKPT